MSLYYLITYGGDAVFSLAFFTGKQIYKFGKWCIWGTEKSELDKAEKILEKNQKLIEEQNRINKEFLEKLESKLYQEEKTLEKLGEEIEHRLLKEEDRLEDRLEKREEILEERLERKIGLKASF